MIALGLLPRDLYALMGEKIKPFVAQNGKYVDQQAVGSADVLALLKFYQSAGDSVRRPVFFNVQS